MRTLFLLVNAICDIRCTYCFYETGHEERFKDRISAASVAVIAARIAATGFLRVILTGGDPLHSRLKQDTYALIRELKKNGMQVIINTSGARLTDEDLDILVESHVDRIDFSIDSHLAEIHDAQRGRYADTVDAIRGLRERSYESIVTTTVITDRNASSLNMTLEWLRELGISDCRVQPAFLPGNPNGSTGAIESMRNVPQFVQAEHWDDYLELTVRGGKGESAPENAECLMGKQYFVCDPKGKLTPCFHRADVVLGNLFEDPIEKIVSVLDQNQLTPYKVPPCFGKHCTSLFDNPKCWRKKDV